MTFCKGRKVGWSHKIGPCFPCPTPQIGINRGHRGQHSLADKPKFDIFKVLSGYLWWVVPRVCMPPEIDRHAKGNKLLSVQKCRQFWRTFK